jgi:tetratricopeptide (TPR) repeat protein
MSAIVPARTRRRWEVPLQGGIIALAGWWVFSPALRGGWLWDDPLEISENPLLRTWAGLGKIWFSRSTLDYFPLKSSVEWLLWQVWGDQPSAYHWVSLALHFLSACLFWRVLSKLGVRLAWLGGLFFVAHPLAVESVAWISELKNTLSLALLLGAALAYLDYDDSRGAKITSSYLLSVVLFLLAMLSKSTVVMFPFVLLLYAWWRRGRIGRRDLAASLPFFAISLALGAATLWFQHNRAMPGEQSVHLGGFTARAAQAGLAGAFYLSKCLWPLGLLPIYPRGPAGPAVLTALLPWGVLAIALGWLWTRRTSWGRPVLFGLGWFLFNLAPVLGFIPMAYQRVTGVADHFAYLSLLGPIGLATAGLGQWYGSGRTRAAVVWPVSAGGLVVAGLAVQSHAYAAIFRDEESFWTYTVRYNPDAWIAQSGLGKIRLEQGRLTEAQADFQRALQLEPDSAEVEANLGTAYFRMGDAVEAMAHLEQAVRIDPGFAGAYYDQGVVLLQTGQPAAAAQRFTVALRLNPNHAGSQNNLGLALARLGRPADAVPHYQSALRLKADFPEAWLNLGNAYFNLGKMTEAIGCYEAALRSDSRYAAAHHNLAYALQRVGRLDEARVQFAEAARLGAKP